MCTGGGRKPHSSDPAEIISHANKLEIILGRSQHTHDQAAFAIFSIYANSLVSCHLPQRTILEVIRESENGLDEKRLLQAMECNLPAMDVFNQSSLLQVLSNQTLNVSRDGASTTSQRQGQKLALQTWLEAWGVQCLQHCVSACSTLGHSSGSRAWQGFLKLHMFIR